jgi:hypothetical protein
MPGVSFQSRAEAVGHDEDALASVGRSEVVSTHHERPSGVARLLQIREDRVSAESAEARYVLSDDPTGSEFSDDAEHFGPEPPRVRVAAPRAGNGDGLAGESTDDGVDGSDSVQKLICPDARALRKIDSLVANALDTAERVLRFVVARAAGERVNVVVAQHVGPMARKDAAAVLIELDLCDARPARALQSEVDAADPGEERHEPQRAHQRHVGSTTRIHA